MDELLFRQAGWRIVMKRFLVAVTLCVAFCANGFAQQIDNTPATKEDVQRYFDVMHSRDLMSKMVDAMIKPMHQMVHDQYLKDKDRLPADFESRMNKQMDDMLKEMPWDEMIQAEMPAFQKHLTKGDIDSILAFYTSPTGQKLLKEMPEIMAEAMESAMPVIRRYIEGMGDRVQKETAELLRESQKKAGQVPGTKN
jgi:hypothetical protein